MKRDRSENEWLSLESGKEQRLKKGKIPLVKKMGHRRRRRMETKHERWQLKRAWGHESENIVNSVC